MGLTCIIEGVEEEDELHTLIELGGRYIQGYFYSPALPAGDIANWLARPGQQIAQPAP